MLVPVRCFTCGKLIADKYNDYQESIKAGKEPEKVLKNVYNAGSVFLGRYSPEAIGDYVAGPNHVLPTGRTARFSSGLGVTDFLKKITFTKCNKKSLQLLSNSAIKIAKAEGLEAHALSINMRKKNNG